MITAAGFGVVEAANADEPSEFSKLSDITRFSPISRCRARWTIEAPRAVRGAATDQDCRDLRPRRDWETDLPEGGRFLPNLRSNRCSGVLREVTAAVRHRLSFRDGPNTSTRLGFRVASEPVIGPRFARTLWTRPLRQVCNDEGMQ